MRRHHAVQRLVVEERRDLEAGFGDQAALDGVDVLGDHLGRLVPNQAHSSLYEEGFRWVE
jgi:hypothetical protein